MNITIELCPADRDRVDALIEALGILGLAQSRIADKMTQPRVASVPTVSKVEDDEVNRALREVLAKVKQKENETLAEAPKNAQEATEVSTPSTVPQEEEQPTPEEPDTKETVKTVTLAEVKAKVVELLSTAVGEQVRVIIRQYAPKVTAIPEDKLAEVYAKLNALEV